MEITPDTVAYLEKLAYLKLDDEQRQSLGNDLAKILNFAQQLAELHVDDAATMTHAAVRENVLRPDVITPSVTLESALKNAPMSDGQYYLVPKVLD